jgi:chorismate synthase
MSGNSFGKSLVLTTFGESHGVAVGGVLDGLPSNLEIDLSFIQSELNRRRPGLDLFSSPRNEDDTIELLSGIYNGKSTGAPIAFLVYNHDQNPSDYEHLKDLYRPSHADFTYRQKYGIRDPRGGGRSSARETIARVAGGAFAKLFLQSRNIRVNSRISQIGHYLIADPASGIRNPFPDPAPGILNQIPDPASVIRDPFPDPVSGMRNPAPDSYRDSINDPEILAFLEQLKADGDTTGGIISCTITGVPAGLGEPVFDKLQADLAKAMLSINAVKGFEFGSGFTGAAMKGSEHNDRFVNAGGAIKTLTNHSGGIQGGISNGEEIYFRVAFKPVSTLMMEQETVNMSGETITLEGKGRHDVCVVPRAMPIVEAMAALVIADHLIRVTPLVPAGRGSEMTPTPK